LYSDRDLHSRIPESTIGSIAAADIELIGLCDKRDAVGICTE
jgi:hypothetical protein